MRRDILSKLIEHIVSKIECVVLRFECVVSRIECVVSRIEFVVSRIECVVSRIECVYRELCVIVPSKIVGDYSKEEGTEQITEDRKPIHSQVS